MIMKQCITKSILIISLLTFSCSSNSYNDQSRSEHWTPIEIAKENYYRKLAGVDLIKIAENKNISNKEMLELDRENADRSFSFYFKIDGSTVIEIYQPLICYVNVNSDSNHYRHSHLLGLYGCDDDNTRGEKKSFYLLLGIFNGKTESDKSRWQIFPLISYSEFPSRCFDWGSILYRHQSREGGYFDQGLLSLLWTAQGHHNELGYRNEFDILPWGILYHQESSSSSGEFSILRNLYRHGRNTNGQSCGTIFYFFSWGNGNLY
ncbi:MAG: hypothetical protein RL095_585 [Verrucomicrobiota bacterium]